MKKKHLNMADAKLGISYNYRHTATNVALQGMNESNTKQENEVR
jgi:hypothetical protein